MKKPLDPRLERYKELWEDELAGAALYRALARSAGERKAGILRALAEAEERHAGHWARLLADAGVRDLTPPAEPLRVRVLSLLSRLLGADAVLPLVLRYEAADAEKYDRVPEAPTSMSADERAHGRVVSAMTEGSTGSRIARAEGRHRVGAGGALRAAVFGFNDGLVSNVSLIMGVAGGTGESRIVLLAGIAGLVAGAFSMAAGEWVSVRSQRELYEREIVLEQEELTHFPEEERDELALLFRAKGIPDEQADALADQVMSQPDTALETLVREELGLDPGDLASPWVAALSSFATFALGALVPVLPYIFADGSAAFILAALLSAVMLVGAGVLISVFTGRPPMRSGLRLLAIGAVAAAVTYGVGTALGVAVG